MRINLTDWGLDLHEKYCKDEFPGEFLREESLKEASRANTARIITQHNEDYTVVSEAGFSPGTLTGKMRFSAHHPEDLPCVGDWVYGEATPDLFVIQGLHPRRTKISRKRPGKEKEQLIAANVDIMFLVQGLDENFNPRRMERLLVMAKQSGSTPIILLTKADIATDLEQKVRTIQNLSPETPVCALCTKDSADVAVLRPYLTQGATAVFVGSSGVGKSTLINTLLGDTLLATGEVRQSDGKGKHTTTTRQLILLPGGGILIDTPGMREFGLWSNDESVDSAFPDIEALAYNCKFTDCSHANEPGCAVLSALADGSLAKDRMASYEKLKKEIHALNRKTDPVLQAEEKKKWKTIHKNHREIYKARDSLR